MSNKVKIKDTSAKKQTPGEKKTASVQNKVNINGAKVRPVQSESYSKQKRDKRKKQFAIIALVAMLAMVVTTVLGSVTSLF